MSVNPRKRGRPKKSPGGSIPITIRIESELLAKIKKLSSDSVPYQTFINDLLRRYVDYCSPLAVTRADDSTIDTETFFLRTAPFWALSSVRTSQGTIICGTADKIELRLELLITILCEQLAQSKDAGDRRKKKNNQNSLYIIRRAGETLRSLRDRCDTLSMDLVGIYDLRAKWVYEAMKSLQKAINSEPLSIGQSLEKVKTNDIAEEILKLTRVRYLEEPSAKVAKEITDYICSVTKNMKNPPTQFKPEEISKEDMREKFELAIKRLRRKNKFHSES